MLTRNLALNFLLDVCWGDATGARIVCTVDKILEMTGDDGDEPVVFDD